MMILILSGWISLVDLQMDEKRGKENLCFLPYCRSFLAKVKRFFLKAKFVRGLLFQKDNFDLSVNPLELLERKTPLETFKKGPVRNLITKLAFKCLFYFQKPKA